jgi:hypothetical protein
MQAESRAILALVRTQNFFPFLMMRWFLSFWLIILAACGQTNPKTATGEYRALAPPSEVDLESLEALGPRPVARARPDLDE